MSTTSNRQMLRHLTRTIVSHNICGTASHPCGRCGTELFLTWPALCSQIFGKFCPIHAPRRQDLPHHQSVHAAVLFAARAACFAPVALFFQSLWQLVSSPLLWLRLSCLGTQMLSIHQKLDHLPRTIGFHDTCGTLPPPYDKEGTQLFLTWPAACLLMM